MISMPVGTIVELKKDGKRGEILSISLGGKRESMRSVLVKWEDGTSSKVYRKDLRRLG